MTRAALLAHGILAAVLIAFLAAPALFAPLLRPFAAHNAPPIYTQTPLWSLTLSHLALTAAATALAALVAVGLAVLVTRPAGREFLPLSRALANIGQSFPPAAVLALAVPIFGFGAKPTLIALFLYGLLPIFETTLTGLLRLPPKVLDAGRGIGMEEGRILRSLELPLAVPAILAGLRLSAIISLATATIGSTVAASTLGETIMAGLLSGNTAFVIQGAFVVGALAVLINFAFQILEARAARRVGALREAA